jgi:glycosyltransferase involved in cell wall biosynthesis
LNKKTVALLYCDRLHIGGVETHLLALLRHGKENKWRWIIMAPVSSLFRSKANAMGAKIVSWKPRHALDPWAILTLIRLLKKYRVNLVHSHSSRASIFAQIAASLSNIPVVLTFHQPLCALVYENGSMGNFKRWYWLYLKISKVLNRLLTNRIIHVSSRAQNEAFELGLAPSDKTVVIRNGVDVSKFSRNKSICDYRKKNGVPRELMVITCIGRLHDQKGIDLFLDSIKIIEPYMEKTQVWIVGDGPRRIDLKNQADKLGLTNVVRFWGFKSEIVEILEASDIFVLPSRFETGPIVVLEAMAVGLPCVVTDVGENFYVIEQDVSGIIVARENPKALAKALKTVLKDADLRRQMGEAARRRALVFSEKKMVKLIEKEYENVLRYQNLRK